MSCYQCGLFSCPCVLLTLCLPVCVGVLSGTHMRFSVLSCCCLPFLSKVNKLCFTNLNSTSFVVLNI